MTSTVAIGRAFENHSMKFLNHHLNMCVRRVGGSGDQGIDLRGWWYVPRLAARSSALPLEAPRVTGGTRSRLNKWGKEMREGLDHVGPLPGYGVGRGQMDQYGVEGWKRLIDEESLREGGGERDGEGGEGETRRLRVLAQCKAESKPLSTRYVREMEGVMAHFHGRDAQLGPHQYDATGRRLDRQAPQSVAVLLSRNGFTSNATVRAWKSPSPMILVHLPGGSSINPNVIDDGEGEEGRGMRVVGCWWNPALSGLKGLLGGTMEMRREILDDVNATENVGREGRKDVGPRDQWRLWYKGKRLGRVGPSVEQGLASRA